MELTRGTYQAVGKNDVKWDRLVDRAMKENIEHLHGLIWERLLALARARPVTE